MLSHLSLGGDGDEVDAIERVEDVLGIAFDIEDCERFVTVGDVWAAVLKETRLSEEEAAHLWRPMVEALCEESGDDPAKVTAETQLLAQPFVDWLKERLSRLLRR